MKTGGRRGARADEREVLAGQRERKADQRERQADERETRRDEYWQSAAQARTNARHAREILHALVNDLPPRP